MDQHFFPERKKEIKAVLDEFGFEKILLGAYNKLLRLKESSSGFELLGSSNFNTTFSIALCDINQGLAPISDEIKKAHAKTAVAELTIRLIFELVRELEVELTEAAPFFDEIAQVSCKLYGYDYDDFRKYINLGDLEEFSQDLSGTEEARKQRPTKKNMIAWQLNERAKAELVDRIRKKRKWARRPNRLHKLFDNPDDNLKIFWSADHLEELAYLIYNLHGKEIIGCLGNRGTYSAIEKHLYDFDGNKIRKGRLKSLSHRIDKNKKRYEHRLTPVTEIIEAVRKIGRN